MAALINNIDMKKLVNILSCLAVIAMLASCGGKQNKVPNSMVYRPLGDTGLQVSEISIGCAAFGKLDTAQCRAFMQVALDSGVNYIDIYDPDPIVRSNIGYALQGRRDEMIIQGHIGCWWNGDDYERTRDVEKCKIGFEDLLNRLGTDHIEVGMIHIVDDPNEWDTLVNSPYMEYVKQLKAEGKIQHIGVSSHNVAAALKAVKSGIVEVIMFSINPAFDRVTADNSVWNPESFKNMLPGIDPMRVEFFDYCTQHHIGVTNMKTFGGGGRLLDAERSPLGFALTVDQCNAYVLAKPCVSTSICGACTIDELQADLHYLHATEAEKDYNTALNNGGNTAKASTGCTYCNHCAPCPQGIQIAKVNQLLDKAEVAKAQGQPVPDDVKQAYEALDHHASECTHCGSCVGRCPFSVNVPERMDAAKEIFGK